VDTWVPSFPVSDPSATAPSASSSSRHHPIGASYAITLA
jgi:hypothetical protein